MKSNLKKKSFRAGMASLLLSLIFLILSTNFIAADSLLPSKIGAESVGIFSYISYLFFGCSIVFFLFTVFKKD
jgi:hypothetical protein